MLAIVFRSSSLEAASRTPCTATLSRLAQIDMAGNTCREASKFSDKIQFLLVHII